MIGPIPTLFLIIARHEDAANMPVSAWRRWLLSGGESLAPKHFVRGDEPADGLCHVKNRVARGAMNMAMVGFGMTGECNRCTPMPFAATTFVAYNVLRFPTPREPTARAAKGCPPPFTQDRFPRPRWPAAAGRDAEKAC
jgi:hypothetical protein